MARSLYLRLWEPVIKMHYRKLLFFIFALLFLTFSFLKPVMADTVHEGDITLTGNDVFVIEDTTYTQTGNIFIRDNAKLIIRNSTIVFNVTYHGQFEIWVEDKGVIEVINSNIQPGINENATISASGEATVIIDNTDLSNGSGLCFLAYGPETAYKGSATISNSEIHYLDIPFSSYASPSISFLNTNINQWVMRCIDYQGDFSDLKPGLFDDWSYKEGSYSITLENTNINLLTLQCEEGQVIIRNSDFFFLGCVCRSNITLKVVDSIIEDFPFHGFDNDCSVQLSNLKPGLYSQWNLRDHTTGTSNCIPDVILENTQINSWAVHSWGANLSIDNSDLSNFRSYDSQPLHPPDVEDIISISNSMIDELMFYYSESRLIFDNTTIGDNVNVYLPSNATMEGNISFVDESYVSNWLESTIKRIYPVLLIDSNDNTISNASLYLYSKNNDLLWTGTTDSAGKASFKIEFNDDNYTDSWKLAIEHGGKIIHKEIKFLSSTPIGLNEPEKEENSGVCFIATAG